MHNPYYLILYAISLVVREKCGSHYSGVSNEPSLSSSIPLEINKDELKSISIFAIKTNVFLLGIALASMYACHSKPNSELILLLIWVPYAVLYIAVFLFNLIFSFKAGKWLFLLTNFVFNVFLCFVISFAFGDGSGSHGGIASTGIAIGSIVAVISVFTPLIVWQHVKP